MNQRVTERRRARSKDQKDERKRAILVAAEAHLRESGFEKFSVTGVARQADLVKGTIYLYFDNREDLLLALYVEKLGAWGDALVRQSPSGMSDLAFIRNYREQSLADPLYLQLVANLTQVIQRNISPEKLAVSKRITDYVLERLSTRLSERLDMTAAQVADALSGLGLLMVGVSLRDESNESEFEKQALRIVGGIRAESR